MALKNGGSQTTKRKKPEDMDDSPPKRVTRAQSTRMKDADTTAAVSMQANKSTTKAPARASTKANAKVSTEVPSRVATSKKGATTETAAGQEKGTAPTKSTKRKAETDEVPELGQMNSTEPPMSRTTEAEPKPGSSRGAGRRTQVKKQDEGIAAVDPSKPKGRRTRTVANARADNRSTKATKPASVQGATVIQEAAPKPVFKKTTRTRNAVTSGASASVGTTQTVAKKRVKFQEDLDKENRPVETEGAKKLATRAGGIRAMPVRRAAAPRITRGRKNGNTEAQTSNPHGKESMPLSPKKVNQVAKAGSASSDDELTVAHNTPMKSPTKTPVDLYQSPVRPESVEQGSEHQRSQTSPSPPKVLSTTVLGSPAKRPPFSPSKDGLTASPRKVDLNFSPTKSVFQGTVSKTPTKSSLLQESPRKGKIQMNPFKNLMSSQSPTKSSMLQSPARRPLVSPFKGFTPVRAIPVERSNKKAKSGSTPDDSPALIAASNPLRAARSPEHMLPLHNITPEVQKIALPTISDLLFADSHTTANDVIASIAEQFCEGGTGDGTSTSDSPGEEDKAPVEASVAPAVTIKDTAPRRVSMESGSTDELASPDKKYAPTPLKKNGQVAQDFATPSTATRDLVDKDESQISFTPLVGKLNGWAASSPAKSIPPKSSRKTRGMFSLAACIGSPVIEQDESTIVVSSPAKTSFFDDQMAVMADEKENSLLVGPAFPSHTDENVQAEIVSDCLRISQESQSSEEYGDENIMPSIAEALREEQDGHDQTLSCKPAKLCTPNTKFSLRPQEIHTVSKVPLRLSAEQSPLKIPRQRSRSLGGHLAAVPELQGGFSRKPEDASEEFEEALIPPTPQIAAATSPQTPIRGMRLDMETPGRTIRKGVVPDVLKGTVVYVDVHTSEGADASGIFIDLLSQMGARCVKQWSWNPRVSLGTSLEKASSGRNDFSDSSPSAGKIGITHVVYKDGGKRTLEKVRASGGAVLCVGVGWVLE